MFFQPILQPLVIGQSAHQRHRRVCMKVHQSRNQRVRRKIKGTARLAPLAHFRARQYRGNAVAGDRHGMVVEHDTARFDWDHPVRLDHGVGRKGSVHLLHGCSKKKPCIRRAFTRL